MKTLLVILGLVIGTTMGANAQTQSQAKPQAKPATTSQPQAKPATTTTTTTTTTQQQAQPIAQTRTMIKVTELPKPVQDNLATHFKGWAATAAYKLDSKGTYTYEVRAKKGTNEMMLLYDKDGKVLKDEPVAAATPQTNKAATQPKHESQAAPAPKPAAKPK